MNDRPYDPIRMAAVARAIIEEIEAAFDAALHDAGKQLGDRFGSDAEAGDDEDDIVARVHDIVASAHAVRDIDDILADCLRWPMDRILRQARKRLAS
jgi:hypothetical protein